MKKGMMFMFLLLIGVLISCSPETDAEEDKSTEGDEAEETTENKQEIAFSYELSGEESLDIVGVDPSNDGSKLYVTTDEFDEAMEDEYFTYISAIDEKPINTTDLAVEGDSEKSCSAWDALSPNGKYLAFTCVKDHNAFAVYDTEAEKIIHNETDSEGELDPEYMITYKVEAITNDKDVILAEAYKDSFIVYHLENGKTDIYDMGELTDHDNAEIESIDVTEDGQKIFVNATIGIYLMDKSTGDLEELENSETYEEKWDTDGLEFSHMKVSPNGKYLYYIIHDTFQFVNLETKETKAFDQMDDYHARNIDDEGNTILYDIHEEEYYLFNAETEESHFLPIEEDYLYENGSTGFNISPDGKYFFYSLNVEDDENDTIEYRIYRFPLNDKENFETADFKGKKTDE